MTTGQPVRVVLVDDVELVTHGLTRMLEEFVDRVVVVAGDGELARDIHLVDLDPHATSDRADIARLLAQSSPGRLVVWSWELDAAHIEAALAGGAAGYLTKMLTADELVDALERIHAGERVVSAVAVAPTPHSATPTWRGREQGLTQRESQIVVLITAGLSNQEIAEQSFLSINSVKSYIRSGYRKMGVGSRSRAVLWGIEHGFRDS